MKSSCTWLCRPGSGTLVLISWLCGPNFRILKLNQNWNIQQKCKSFSRFYDIILYIYLHQCASIPRCIDKYFSWKCWDKCTIYDFGICIIQAKACLKIKICWSKTDRQIKTTDVGGNSIFCWKVENFNIHMTNFRNENRLSLFMDDQSCIKKYLFFNIGFPGFFRKK